MSISVEEIKKAYSEDKQEADKSEWFAYYVIRPVSFYFTMLFIKFDVTANKITWLSLFMALLGSVLIGFGSYAIQLIGGLLLIGWLILDHVDGNVARYTNTQCSYGDFLDTIAGYIMLATFPLALGIAAYFEYNGRAYDYWFIIFGGLAAVFNILPRLMYQKFLNYGVHGENYRKIFGASDETRPVSFVEMAFKLVNNLLNPSGFLLIILFLVIAVELIGSFLVLYATINFMIVVVTIVKLSRHFTSQTKSI